MHDTSHEELCQCQTVLTVPSAWLINTLLSPYQAKKGVGEGSQDVLVSYVMSAKRHCQLLVLGTVINPKSTPLTGVQYVSMHCVLILVLGYITLRKDYTSEIIKITRHSVKPIQKMFNMFKKMFNMSKETTQSKWDNLCSNSLTAWAYSTYTQVPESSIQIYHV